jgi:hypothetical protein
MARTAGQALFTGLCAAISLTCLVLAFLAFVGGGGGFALGLVFLSFLSGVAGWACDSARDRTSAASRDRLKRE